MDKEGKSPLHWAAEQFGSTPAYYESRGWYLDIFKLLLARKDVEINRPDGDGHTILQKAAGNGWTEIVRELLKEDAIDTGVGENTGQTALYWAARNGHVDAVRLLLAKPEVKRDLVDSEGKTPLDWATEKYSSTPEYYDSKKSYLEIVKLLTGQSGK